MGVLVVDSLDYLCRQPRTRVTVLFVAAATTTLLPFSWPELFHLRVWELKEAALPRRVREPFALLYIFRIYILVPDFQIVQPPEHWSTHGDLTC